MTPEGLPGGIFRFLWQVRATDPLLLLAWLPRCAVPVLSCGSWCGRMIAVFYYIMCASGVR